MNKIKIATRGSKLALWQANHIKAKLQSAYNELEVELVIVKTKGDIILDVPLAKVGGKGLFVKEIEESLLNGQTDIAVHSMKDVPMQLAQELILGCIPKREDASDTFLSTKYHSVKDLPNGSRVGTSSLRRQAQLLAMRPDLQISSLRGNIDTRVSKLLEGKYDAIILATSGLKRLGLHAPVTKAFNPYLFLPAVGQGALGIECLSERIDIIETLFFMEHRETRICIEAERGLLAGLEGGCQVPIAGYATMSNPDTFTLEGLVASIDGVSIIREKITAKASQARQSGLDLAQKMQNSGAKDILSSLYS